MQLVKMAIQPIYAFFPIFYIDMIVGDHKWRSLALYLPSMPVFWFYETYRDPWTLDTTQFALLRLIENL